MGAYLPKVVKFSGGLSSEILYVTMPVKCREIIVCFACFAKELDCIMGFD